MRDDPTAVTDYLLRVATEEIEYLEDHDLLRTFPHLAAFIRNPLGHRLLQQVQNLCWTAERVWRRLRHRQRMATSAPAVTSAPMIDGPGIRPQAPLWIDVTNASRTGYGGGIDRVAMQLARAGIETGSAVPVVIENNGVRPLVRPDGDTWTLAFGPGITYVIVDAFWHQIDEYVAVCTTARERGAKVVICFHDVIPFDYPSLSRGTFNDKFADSFARIVAQSDACVTVSGYTGERVRSLIEALRLRVDRPLPIASFRLGADGHAGKGDGAVRDRIRDVFRGDRVFLGVGTLEPRKGYAVALDAFDSLWRRGVPCSFVILGRYGWIAKALQRRILTHPLYGKALHWVADASDAELAFAYRNAYCLVQASIIEGFGLPIVEANREGTPVIATDNAIFRELAGDAITYFRSCDSADLAAAVERAIDARPKADQLALLSWGESLAQMAERIRSVLPKPDLSSTPDFSATPESALRCDGSADVSASSEDDRFGLRRKMPYVRRSAPLGRQLPEGAIPCRNGAVPASIF